MWTLLKGSPAIHNGDVISTPSYNTDPCPGIRVTPWLRGIAKSLARRAIRACPARTQTIMDLELLSPPVGPSLETGLDHSQSSPAQAVDQEYVPPNGGYGWVCVACVFLINAHTWGFNFVSGPLPRRSSHGTLILTCRLSSSPT